MIKKAMILSAGFGKRLNPLTLNQPKPLLKIGKYTLLSNTLNFLEKAGIEMVVINVHYLSEQIIDYIKKNKFNLKISIIEEKDKILDTGGGILNAMNHFSKEPFLVVNPDTIWNLDYLNELEFMKKLFFKDKENKCFLLVVNKSNSFDKTLKGDFNLDQNLINRNNKNNFDYIYTGLQIIKPDIFSDIELEVFSINRIWDGLIKNQKLHGVKSNINFLHVSTLDVYKSLLKKFKS